MSLVYYFFGTQCICHTSFFAVGTLQFIYFIVTIVVTVIIIIVVVVVIVYRKLTA